jgi:curved DNA-binding protein
MPQRDRYSILGVPDDANVQAIKNAYRRLVRKVHPDTGNEPDPARFRDVHEAYLVSWATQRAGVPTTVKSGWPHEPGPLVRK